MLLFFYDISGNVSDSFTYHNGMKFTTYDRHNDLSDKNCAASYKGAWWYKHCQYSNLNGLYHTAKESSMSGVRWYHWKRNRSLKEAEMKIRPAQF